MNNHPETMKKKKLSFAMIATALLLAVIAISFDSKDTDYFFKINKSLDIMGRVYKEVSINYVDEVDPEKFMEAGIDGLLGTLDPYTNFINETEGDEVELITTGQYGGIGITVGVRDGYITILSLMQGYTAQKQGLQVGDRIIEVDGKPIVGSRPDAVRSMTKGEVGTEVRLKIDRDGENDPISFTLIREEIQLKNVTYSSLIDPGIGYIKLEHFSRDAGTEMRLAIQDLKAKGTLRGIVLDLRDNPGGLLDAAVDVVEKFVPKGSLIVSTKGRKPDSEKKYTSNEEPIVPNIPLIVLVNHNSASASEIVTGAIQDLDRGVILGTRSFGKGLVQTIAPLPYNNQLKITTAKYYTPSGRCIQEIDYLHRDNNGSFTITADSLRHEFKTATGRRVFERGGITPDSVVEFPELSSMNKELLRKVMYFKFATSYVAEHKSSADAYLSDPSLMTQFADYIKKQNFSYQDEGEKKLLEFKELADKASYGTSVRKEIDDLQKELAVEKLNAFQKYNREIQRELMMELASRSHGDQGRIAASLKDDIQLAAAEEVLSSQSTYSRLLKRSQ